MAWGAACPNGSAVGAEAYSQQDRAGEVQAVVGLVAIPAAAHLPGAVDERPFLDAEPLHVAAIGDCGREADAHVGSGDEEFVGSELEHHASADRTRRIGIGPRLDPGPFALAELPQAELSGDPPAAEYGRLVGAVAILGEAPAGVREGEPRPIAGDRREQAEWCGEGL